jgi:membrane-associated phospholipid phosphatase
MVTVLGLVVPARAQSSLLSRSACDGSTSSLQLITGTVHSFRQLPSKESLGILAAGSAATLAVRPLDGEVSEDLSNGTSLRNAFRPGTIVGGTPLQLGAALTTYAIGRALNKPCAVSVGADLVQAQLMATALTIGFKQATRRSRPEGSGFSFPSGHTSTAFASATVLQRHFGWKVGVPAYAVASYVAASRVEMRRHYWSDVAFGATIGILAGRSVTVGHGHQFMLVPLVSPDGAGAGAGFTWIGKK